MSLYSQSLHDAIYDRLSAIFTERVYNFVPQQSRFPYAVIGEKTSIPDRTKSEDGQQITVTIHIWSNQAGDRECAGLMQQVYDALDRQEGSITLATGSLTEILCEFSQLLQDTSDAGQPDHYYHGVMRFRALVTDS